MNSKIWLGSSIIGILITAIAAIVGWVVLPKVIDGRIEDETRLIPGSETWDKWATITLPIQLKFFIYHVTNPDEVENDGKLPILEEFGPYIYDEIRVKGDLEIKSDSVFYRQNITYIFNEESFGPDTDAYNVINVAFLSVIDGVGDNPDFAFALPAIAQFLYDEGERIILRNVSVADLTFNGYDVSTYTENDLIKRFLTKEFDGGRFGLYKGKNETDDGFYQVNSGISSSSRFGEIIEWDHKRRLGYWNTTGGDTCDMINGTDGSIFPPFVTEDRILRVYVVDMCRSLYLTYIGEQDIRDIKGYVFSTPPDVLEDPRTNEWNRCFCLKEDVSDCDRSGVLDVGSCRSGAPIVMSTPHFLGGNPMYQNHSGLIPDIEKHRTIMILEPNSGVLLNARKRIQVNIRLQQYPASPIFANVPEMVFPVIWAEEIMLIDEENADYLKDKLKPIKIVNISRWTVLGIGIFMAVAGGILFFVQNRRANKNKDSPSHGQQTNNLPREQKLWNQNKSEEKPPAYEESKAAELENNPSAPPVGKKPPANVLGNLH